MKFEAYCLPCAMLNGQGNWASFSIYFYFYSFFTVPFGFLQPKFALILCPQVPGEVINTLCGYRTLDKEVTFAFSFLCTIFFCKTLPETILKKCLSSWKPCLTMGISSPPGTAVTAAVYKFIFISFH